MKAILNRIQSIFDQFQWRQFAATCCVALILLATSASEATLDAGVRSRVDDLTAKGEAGRPRTTAQWQAENEALQGNPGQQLQRIAQETADAVEEMAEIYPQNVKTLTPGVSNGRLPQDD